MTSPRTVMKERPSISQRGASQHTLFQTDLDMTAFVPPTPRGSIRESKRRSRAPSITSMRSFASRTQVSSLAAPDDIDNGKHGHDPTAFPRAHLVENLRRFMRYSSAAYGQNFMRILGIGSLDYFFPDTSKHHANVWAFAHHVGIPVDCILLNSFSEAQPLFTEQMSPLVNYVAVDDAAQAVVLTCRGTMGLSDILTDLTCDFETIAVEGGRSDKQYQVHSGMLASTRRLCNENSTVMQTLRLALEDNPDYGLVLTGHSLGGGVAALAAVELSCPADLFRQQVLRRRAQHGKTAQHPKIHTPFVTSLDSGLPPGRPIHAYAYGVPAVASPDLSAHCKGLVTSIIHGHDFVPTLSLGMVRDFKNIAHALSVESDSDVAREIITRVIGTYRKRSALRSTLGFKQKTPEHLASLEPPRPQEIPLAEREVQLSREELIKGKTRNLATDSNYTDPNLKEDELDPFSYSSGGGQVRTSPSTPQLSGQQGGGDVELADWLWSLIKTIRADMDSDKLYPPGDVYCIESFAVFVTPSMSPDSDIVFDRSKESQGERRAEAHRVILRYCEDVVKRFSEPIFAKSMLRDHIPTNYELCMSLLYESVIDSKEG
uniref:sn-1-specific diacylglycerol lipase n=2 Tax=Kalmanozyma brasiliensis (strain GHG001) TaxID=1365824 RepID=V5F0V9_KALBG